MTNEPENTARQRAEERRTHAANLRTQEKRRRRRGRAVRWGALTAGVVLVGGLVTLLAVNGQASSKQPAARSASSPSSNINTLNDIPMTPAVVAVGARAAGPWSAPVNASGRAALAGLPMLSAEGTAEHIHSHLSVTVDGQQIPVPADIGIDLAAQRISPLHTHDTTGIIHVESPVAATFTLGQFFTEWNVALDANRIGGYATSDGHTMTTFVDGKKFAGNPAAITFADHADIDIVYAKAGEVATAPAAFTWPDGY